MKAQFAALQSYQLKAGASFVRPTQSLPEKVKLNYPATDVMTDLNKISVVSVRAKTPMDNANTKMIKYGIRMLLVLDEEEQVAGLLTANDVLGEKPMRFLQTMGGTHADILVSDIMTPQNEMEVLGMDEVKDAKVGDIVASLKQAHRQHSLVVSSSTDDGQRVCGLFSITQIARQLGAQAQSFELAHTITEIEAVIAKG
ncbi:MAG: CBS domain-containing protein [Gallionella sp.]